MTKQRLLRSAGALVFAAGSVVACGNGNNGDDLWDADNGSAIDAQATVDGTSVVAAPNLSGTWQFTSGDFLPAQQLGNLQSLILNDDGTGSVNSISTIGNIQGCASITYIALSNDVLALNLGAFGTHAHARSVHHLGHLSANVLPQVIFGGGVQEGTQLVNFTLVGDTLTITDTDGAVATFARHAGSQPACLPTSMPELISLPVNQDQQPQQGGEFLITDGTNLFYSTDAQSVQAISPSDGSAGASISLTNEPTTLYGIDGTGNLWLDYGSGGSSLYVYDQAGQSVATLNLGQPPYNLNVNIGAIAFDGSTLWVYANDEANNGAPELLSFDVSENSSTPPLTSTLPFAKEFGLSQGLAAANGKLWAIGFFLTPVIAEIDPATGNAISTYSMPYPPSGNYRGGLAVIGNDFYSFLDDVNGAPALVHLVIQ